MKIRRWIAPAAVMIACVIATAPLAQGQVLKQVPSDALVVIKINKLKAVSDKVASLATKFGIAGLNPAMADPLGALQNVSGMTAGVDPNGEAAIVMVNQLQAVGPGQRRKEPPMIVLMPVTDYKAFVGTFADAKTEGDTSIVHFKSDKDDTFVQQWGTYAAFTNQKDLLAKKPDGLTVQGLAAKELDTKDIVIFGNMKSVRAMALPQLQKAHTQILSEMEKSVARSGQANAANVAKYMPVLKAAINRLLDVAESALADLDSATYGVSLSDAGVNVTMLGEFAPASPSAARVKDFKNTDAPLLAGLPDGKYLFFAGSATDPKPALALINDFLAPIEKELTAMGADGKPFLDYGVALKKYIAAARTSVSGVLAPTGALGQESLFQMVNVIGGDADALVAAQRDMFNSQQALMAMIGGPKATAAVKTTYTANAKTIDGVALNQFQTQFTAAGTTPQEMQVQQMMTMMYGPNGMNGYSGAVGKDKVIIAMGANDEIIGKLVATAKSGDDVLSKSAAVQAIQPQLPLNRMAVMYLPLDQVATTVVSYAKQFGMPINLQLPANLPPIGFTAGTEGSAIRFDVHVPAQLIQSLIAGGMQAYMQMMQGRPGGPGGL